MHVNVSACLHASVSEYVRITCVCVFIDILAFHTVYAVVVVAVLISLFSPSKCIPLVNLYHHQVNLVLDFSEQYLFRK